MILVTIPSMAGAPTKYAIIRGYGRDYNAVKTLDKAYSLVKKIKCASFSERYIYRILSFPELIVEIKKSPYY